MNYSRRWDVPERPKEKPIEYITVDNFKKAVESLVRNDEEVLEIANKAIGRTDELCTRHDTMRKDLNELFGYQSTIQYLWQEVEKLKDASNVAKRKRRVTICANGQTVEVSR